MSPTPRQIGMRLRKIRERQGLTQAVVAGRAGISREYLVRLERGLYDPTVGVVERLAKALGVSLMELLVPGRERPRSRPK
jgi:HTH-type transcriptional regulator / antitoxin HipB